MSARSLLAAAASLAICCGAQAAPADDYAYAWPLQTQGDSAAWQVELTPEVYAAVTRADLRDIEIINAAGEAVPMARHTLPPATQSDCRTTLPMFQLPTASAQAPNAADDAIRMQIRRDADGRLHSLDVNLVGMRDRDASGARSLPRDLLLDASALHAPLASISVHWSSGVNATPRFALSASDDLQQWRSLVADATLLRLEQDGHVLERHEIALANARATYLRLRRLDDGADLPNLVVYVCAATPSTANLPALQWLQATDDGGDTRHINTASPPPADGAVAAYRYHLPAPLTAAMARVELADDNSLVRLSILSREREPYDSPASWVQRGDKLAFRLRQGDVRVDNDEFGLLPAGQARDFRLELATPLARAPKLEIAYRPDRFVFLAQGAAPYRLVAGSVRARRGDYPVDSVLATLRAKLGSSWEPPLAGLSDRTTLRGESALKPEPPAPPRRDWRTWILWGVLVGATALIGGLALSLLRKPNT